MSVRAARAPIPVRPGARRRRLTADEILAQLPEGQLDALARAIAGVLISAAENEAPEHETGDKPAKKKKRAARG